MSAPISGPTALADMKAEAERKAKFDLIGIDSKTFLRLDVPTAEALGCTVKIMTKMLLNVVVLMLGVTLCTTIISFFLKNLTPAMSAMEQFG